MYELQDLHPVTNSPHTVNVTLLLNNIIENYNNDVMCVITKMLFLQFNYIFA